MSLIARARTALDIVWECAHRDAVSPREEVPIPGVRILWPREYPWHDTWKFMGTLRFGLERLVPVEEEEIPQHHNSVLRFEFEVDGKRYPAAIDYSDYPAISGHCVRECFVYFKMQYANGGYGRLNVLPGGYVPKHPALYHWIPALRALRARRRFQYEVYGRFGAGLGVGIRMKALRLLREQDRFRFEGSMNTVRYSRYLREIARSKVCLNLPGNGDFCFRLVDYLAIGSCVISPPLRNRFVVPLVNGQEIVFCREDLADLVDLCQYYLREDGAREAIAAAAARYFDRHLHAEALARHYIESVTSRVR